MYFFELVGNFTLQTQSRVQVVTQQQQTPSPFGSLYLLCLPLTLMSMMYLRQTPGENPFSFNLYIHAG